MHKWSALNRKVQRLSSFEARESGVRDQSGLYIKSVMRDIALEG